MITFKDISIIIPVAPEEKALEALWEDLRPIQKEAELLVVRGSSPRFRTLSGQNPTFSLTLMDIRAKPRFIAPSCG